MHSPAVDLDLPLYKNGGLSRSIGLTLFGMRAGQISLQRCCRPADLDDAGNASLSCLRIYCQA